MSACWPPNSSARAIPAHELSPAARTILLKTRRSGPARPSRHSASLWPASAFSSPGAFICLSRHTGEAAAAAITGAALLILAIIIGLAGGYTLKRIRRRQPSLLSEFGGTLGMAGHLAGFLVRKDPRKAMILSLVAGALAEYITGERKR